MENPEGLILRLRPPTSRNTQLVIIVYWIYYYHKDSSVARKQLTPSNGRVFLVAMTTGHSVAMAVLPRSPAFTHSGPRDMSVTLASSPGFLG